MRRFDTDAGPWGVLSLIHIGLGGVTFLIGATFATICLTLFAWNLEAATLCLFPLTSLSFVLVGVCLLRGWCRFVIPLQIAGLVGAWPIGVGLLINTGGLPTTDHLLVGGLTLAILVLATIELIQMLRVTKQAHPSKQGKLP